MSAELPKTYKHIKTACNTCGGEGVCAFRGEPVCKSDFDTWADTQPKFGHINFCQEIECGSHALNPYGNSQEYYHDPASIGVGNPAEDITMANFPHGCEGVTTCLAPQMPGGCAQSTPNYPYTQLGSGAARVAAVTYGLKPGIPRNFPCSHLNMKCQTFQNPTKYQCNIPGDTRPTGAIYSLPFGASAQLRKVCP